MRKPMTPAQKQLAEEHMDLIPKMIRALTQGFPINSDQRQELCQIGYLALCRAAISCREGFAFAPYATAAIRNAIYDSWRHEIREKDRLCPLQDDLPETLQGLSGQTDLEREVLPGTASMSLMDTEAGAYLETLKASQCGTIQKGIEALCFQLEGYSSQELSAHYRVPANHIRAWQSKARRFLKQDAALCALLS